MEILDDLFIVHLQNLVLISITFLEALQNETSGMVVNLSINFYYKIWCLFQNSTLSLECLPELPFLNLLSGLFLLVKCILKFHLFFKSADCIVEPYTHETLPHLSSVLTCIGYIPCCICVSYLEVLILLIFIGILSIYNGISIWVTIAAHVHQMRYCM